MTHQDNRLDGDSRPADHRSPSSAHGPQAPLVTVVVVNFNFARFLPETLASVLSQTYPRIECIVVDNASTDESVAVIEEIQTRHPSVQLLRRAANDGQTAATIDGIALATGAYVILLDADDLLLPHCVATHVEVHLSSRTHVGFTSGDMLQMVGDQVVLSTGEAMAGFIRSATPTQLLLRPRNGAFATPQMDTNPDLRDRVYLVPRTQKKWVWAPTSGLCFRRDALALFEGNPAAAKLRSQTDLYLALGINAVCGSILIDEPVFVYRLHGANVFSRRAQMVGTLSFDPRRTSENTALARRLLIDQFMSHLDRFVQEPWQALRLICALRQLNVRGGRPDGRRGSYLAYAVTPHVGAVTKAVGKVGALLFMALAGAPLRTIWRTAWHKPAE